MSLSKVNPSHILDSYRKSDAVFIVCQNNALKRFEIAALNEQATRVTGYSNEDLVGKVFSTILPERINSTLEEFVEFGDDTHDLLSVLMKIRNFSVRLKNGSEQVFRLRIIRGEEFDGNPWFHLVLVNEAQQQEPSVSFREILKENFKGHETVNPQTGLPDRLSTIKNIELAIHAVQGGQVKASFAILDMNHFDSIRMEYSLEACMQMHRHIGQVCKQKLRPEDAIGSLNERLVGLLLVDASQEESRMVLNRLRWMIGVTALTYKEKEILTQVNVAFAEVDGKISATQVLEKCEAHILDMRKRKLFNTLELSVTHERRESDDRRQQNIPVENDRRKKDRRED